MVNKRILLRVGLIMVPFILCCSQTAVADSGAKITKCQDAKGAWHYGDGSDEACAHAKITILSGTGVTVKEIAAPLTPAEQREAQAQQKRSEEQRQKDQLLLATYAREEDITASRDRKVAEIDAQIHLTEDTLKTLHAALEHTQAQAAAEQRNGKLSDQTARTLSSAQDQIAKHEAAIAENKHRQDVIKKQSQVDLERFRALKKGATASAPETTTTDQNNGKTVSHQ